jgi:OOP family OmpA-OmpF porin
LAIGKALEVAMLKAAVGLLSTVVAMLMVGTAAALVATLPNADKKGAKDSPLLKRYEGSYIVAQERKAFAEFAYPLSKLEPVREEKTRQNNQRFEPKNKKALEGAYTRIVYLVPENRTPLEVVRNYEEEIKRVGGSVLFQCKETDCGGDPSRSIAGGGGQMSLAMYLYPPERIVEEPHTTGHCAIAEHIADQRYVVAELPQSGAHVSVLTYRLVSPDKNDVCRTLNDRTIAIVDLVETKAREQKMVTVQASEMEKTIASTGRVALYGIYFDFNKAEVKPESDPTLEQIAKLLKQSSAMKLLVVGHTDNVGTFPFNTDLSQRRAVAVVTALGTRYGIAKERLTPVGVSFASPVASNKTDEGRAKNRRVELVEN